jgi:hypothetical protein
MRNYGNDARDAAMAQTSRSKQQSQTADHRRM